MGINTQTLKKYAYNKVFIETGLGRKGIGVQSAVQVGFKKIYSIEFYPKNIERARVKFKYLDQVTLIEGDSGKELGKLLPSIKEPATFWLDAHFDFTANAVQEYPEPLTDALPILKELRAIAKHPIKTHTILIDDLIFIERGHPTWPPIKEADIREALKAINPDYHVYYETGGVHLNRENDILVAETKNERPEKK